MTSDLNSQGSADSSGTVGDSGKNVCFVRARDPKPIVIYADAGSDVDAETRNVGRKASTIAPLYP